MVTYFKLTSNGTQYTDIPDCNVSKKVGQSGGVSSFNATFPNKNGEHKSNFNVGDDIIIYLEKSVNPATAKIFAGVIEDIKFQGRGSVYETIEISGRDYTAILQNSGVRPCVYTNQEISLIVKDLITNYVTGITTTNVAVTTVTTPRISFSNMSVYDAIKQLSDRCKFEFWIDEDKDLHFAARGTVSSGIILDNTNVLSSNFTDTTEGMANEVWIYGDKQMVAHKESFATNGGSVFTLAYSPSNTEVYYNGSTVPVKLGIYQMVSFNPSGVEAMVNYDDKKLIFVSGTDIGNSIPASGGSIVANYDRGRPIIKYGTDRGSIEQYKIRSKTITDNNIKDPNQAKDYLNAELSANSQPKKVGTIKPKNVVNLTAGNTIVINLPYNNINNKIYTIIQADYNIDKESLLADSVLSVKVNDKKNDVLDTIKKMMLDIKALQAKDISVSDQMTRLEISLGSAGARVKTWAVKTRFTGSDILWGYTTWSGAVWDGSYAYSLVTSVSGGEA